MRELWSVELGPVVVGVALVEAGFNDEGGRDEESKSWGKREIAGEVEDNAELVDDDDPLRWDVGDGGGDGFGRPVMIFVAGRMSLITWPFFPLVVSDIPRRRIAPTGISMYSSVAMKCRKQTHAISSLSRSCDDFRDGLFIVYRCKFANTSGSILNSLI